MSEWISVYDRMPTKSGPYFVLFCFDEDDSTVLRSDSMWTKQTGWVLPTLSRPEVEKVQVVCWLDGVPDPPRVIIAAEVEAPPGETT